jgi:hypothetical protein
MKMRNPILVELSRMKMRNPITVELSRMKMINPIPVELSSRAGHNFSCPLISPLSVDPLVNGTTLILHFEYVNLTEERLFLSLFKASMLKIRFCRIF